MRVQLEVIYVHVMAPTSTATDVRCVATSFPTSAESNRAAKDKTTIEPRAPCPLSDVAEGLDSGGNSVDDSSFYHQAFWQYCRSMPGRFRHSFLLRRNAGKGSLVRSCEVALEGASLVIAATC